jgi:lipid II:glycine glycyltransferase (peptidoglycan interpeptide bridge formation enzyme)
VKIIGAEEFLILKSVDRNALPFCFQKDYLNTNSDISILNLDAFFAPVKIQKNKFLKTIQFQFPPVTSNGHRLSLDDEKKFSESAIVFIAEKKLAHRIVQPKNYSLFATVPAKSISVPFGTYKIDLNSKTNDQLLEGMQARYRSSIRQIEKLNVEIRYGLQELKVFQKLHEETMERTSAYSEDHASLSKELKALPDNSLLATIYIDNKIQGGLYVVYSNYGAYYFHGASANTTEASGAIKYLHYKVMCLMREKGVKQYDFVGARLTDISGTKLEGIQNFKKRFGADLVKGYLWKIDLDKPKCKTYDNLLKIKCKLKGLKFPHDIIDQEKNKAIVL